MKYIDYEETLKLMEFKLKQLEEEIIYIKTKMEIQ